MTIDLKNCSFFIRDGFSAAGAVNNAAGYTVGATTMVVDGITGIIPVGTIFTLEGETDEYEVTAHSETSGDTTSITFTPALLSAPADNDVITFSPHQVEIVIGEGNFTYEQKKARQYIKNKGRLGSVRNADEDPMEIAFDFRWDFLRGDTNDPVTIEEALTQTGNASGWVSAASDPCEPYAVDLLIVHAPPCSGFKEEHILIEDFRHESLAHDPKAGQVAVKGNANRVSPTITRVAAA